MDEIVRRWRDEEEDLCRCSLSRCSPRWEEEGSPAILSLWPIVEVTNEDMGSGVSPEDVEVVRGRIKTEDVVKRWTGGWVAHERKQEKSKIRLFN